MIIGWYIVICYVCLFSFVFFVLPMLYFLIDNMIFSIKQRREPRFPESPVSSDLDMADSIQFTDWLESKRFS